MSNPEQSPGLFPEQTIPYLTFIKATVVSALRSAFANHPDNFLAKTNIRLERSQEKLDYPMIVIKYYGRNVKRIGIANVQYMDNTMIPSIPTLQPLTIFTYEGDVEFSVYALDTLTRDRLVDSLITIVSSQNLGGWVDDFYDSVYDKSQVAEPASDYNQLIFNTDEFTPFGATDQATPWRSENELLYKDVYRTNIFGQFMSLPTSDPVLNYINKILLYPTDNAVAADTNPSLITLT
jgi:hypothetical protein